MNIKTAAKAYEDYAVQLRRRFHQVPEIGRQETITCQMVCEELRNMGLSPQVICGTGVIADIGERSRSGRMACIRADMDALEVQEETGAPYASRYAGRMHACGHDGHMAMALTAARILKECEGELNGSVRILFEPGEENSNGALDLIEAGALEGADTIFGIHLWSGIPSGKFSAASGPCMASSDLFTIWIEGKGTHGSLPHRGVDPIVTAAAMIQNIQLALGRELPATETALVSFCQIHGGHTDNVIPDQVTIGGTARAFLPEIRARIPEIMERVIQDTAHLFRAGARLEYGLGTPPVINETAAAKRAQNAVLKNFGPESLISYPGTTGAEDFSEYLQRIPGVFVFLGIDDESCGAVYPNHSSRFTFDESILWKGAAAAAQYCVDFLEE